MHSYDLTVSLRTSSGNRRAQMFTTKHSSARDVINWQIRLCFLLWSARQREMQVWMPLERPRGRGVTVRAPTCTGKQAFGDMDQDVEIMVLTHACTHMPQP